MASITPKKSLGQNFLTDQNIARKIVDSLDIQHDDVIIEIGAGTGGLTKFLLGKGVPVYAIEIDSRAVAVLKSEFTDTRLNVIQSDILVFDLPKFAAEHLGNIKIVGNLPYYISSQILFYVFDNVEFISKAVLMLQKEVAQRLCSRTRTKDYGILTVATELSGSARLLFNVSPKCFYPEPKVFSTLLELNFSNTTVSREKYKKIMILVRTAFNQRRKTLKNSLKDYIEKNTKLTINQYIETLDSGTAKIFTKRAEELTSSDFFEFYELINSHIDDQK